MFPRCLTERRQWITWTLTADGKKIPNSPSNQPKTWFDYDEVKSNDRIAYVFAADDPFVGIDLDNCINDQGEYNEVATYCLDLFKGKAYCETSQSGRGLHFIVRGKKPDWSVCSRSGVECYEHGRFWVMTGYALSGYEEPQECQAELEIFLGDYLRKPEPQRVLSVASIRCETQLGERVQTYAQNAQAAPQGDRNNAAFRLAGHLWAMVGDDGQRPSEEIVLDAVRGWAARCSPPMDDAEVVMSVENARTKGTPRDAKLPGMIAIDGAEEGGRIAELLWPTKAAELASEEDDGDEEFCLAMLPESGLIRMVYDYYFDLAIRPSPIMGLSVAISTMEVLLGQKVATHTDLRTNDYNLIIAQTASGKEACKSTITKVFDAAQCGHLLLAADVQSGNGLITAIKSQPVCLWIGDEFGKVLQGILDKKGSQHLKNIGKHLLSLYGESAGKFLGAAHAAGAKNEIDQPHLCILGLSTGSTIFEGLSADHVSDGLLNRICFWPVQERPKRKRNYKTPKVPTELSDLVSKWAGLTTTVGNIASMNPQAIQFGITTEACERWEQHSFAIDEKMESESSQRSAMWGRTAARSLMLALVHRCSRMASPTEISPVVAIEMQDIQWGVKLSNWLSRIACDLVEQNMVDKSLTLAAKVLSDLAARGPVNSRDALRLCRSLTAGDLEAAAVKLGFRVEFVTTGKRKKKVFVRDNGGQK
jgi:putative DNA primase/helicase